jgi:hypothetical protein
MKLRLTVFATTDGKFVGKELVWDGVSLQLNGFVFESHQMLELGDGLWRATNSNYSAELKKAED